MSKRPRRVSKEQRRDPVIELELPDCKPDGTLDNSGGLYLYGRWNRQSVQCQLFLLTDAGNADKYTRLNAVVRTLEVQEAMRSLHVAYLQRAVGVVGMRMPVTQAPVIGLVFPRKSGCPLDATEVMKVSVDLARKCALQCLAAFAAAHQCGVVCTGSVVYAIKGDTERVHRIRIESQDGRKQKTFAFKSAYKISIEHRTQGRKDMTQAECRNTSVPMSMTGKICFGYKEELIDEHAFTFLLQKAREASRDHETQQFLLALQKSISANRIDHVTNDALCDLKQSGIKRAGDVLLSDETLFSSLVNDGKADYCHFDYDSEIRLVNDPVHHSNLAACSPGTDWGSASD